MPTYDIALSFLATDEKLASVFHNRLSESFEVFYFPENQLALAGTDGMQTMRKPFYDDSRLVVVLFREPWGETPWTGIEQTAIQEGCLKAGWDRLFFVVLDRVSAIPKWVPNNRVRFNYEDFGFEEAIGAIKLRVLENGGSITPLTAAKQAEMNKAEAEYQAERRELESYLGMPKVHAEVEKVLEELAHICADLNAQRHTEIRAGAGKDLYSGMSAAKDIFVVTNNRVSLSVYWRQHYVDSSEGWGMEVREFNRRMQLPTEPSLQFLIEATELRVDRYLPDLSKSREVGWVEEGPKRDGRFHSSSSLAELCVIQFLKLVNRAEKGEVKFPAFR